MKTYKEKIYKKWWKINLISFILCICGYILLCVFPKNIEYAFLPIPIIMILHFFGIPQCPRCKKRLHIPARVRSIDKINFCGQCGFDLTQEPPETWARIDKSATKDL